MSKSETYTVHDWEGLDALPVGTKLTEQTSRTGGESAGWEVVEYERRKCLIFQRGEGEVPTWDRVHDRAATGWPLFDGDYIFVVEKPKKAGLAGPWYAGDPELHGTLLVEDSAPDSVLNLWFYNAHNDSWSCGEWTDEYDCGPENALSEQEYPSSYQGFDAGASGVLGHWGLADVSSGYRGGDNIFVELLTSLLEHAYEGGRYGDADTFADWIKEKLAA